MAYMNQEKKAIIKTELKKVMPKDWKWSLSVQHHSTLILTIKSAPTDLLQIAIDKINSDRERHPENLRMYGMVENNGYDDINTYHINHSFEGELLNTFNMIKSAMDTNNHNRSDSMTDYFDVGHYISISLGSYKKHFVVTN